MPPEEPDPRLREVANALQTLNRPSSQKLDIAPANTACTVA